MSVNATTVLGLVSTVEQALAGPGLTIGSIGLSEMEVPEKLTWGGTQQLVVHKMIGGQRVIDAMGQDDRSLEWSGLLRGPTAVGRARKLDALRVSGANQIITWSDFTYTVVVQSFEADYTRQGYRVPYRISCIIIPQPPAPTKPGLLDSLKSDISSALGLDGLGAEAQQLLSTAQAALPVVGALTGGSSAFVSLSSAVGTASGALGTLTSGAESSLGGIATAASTLGHLIPGVDALTGVAALQSAASSASDLATNVAASGFISRAVANLKSALP